MKRGKHIPEIAGDLLSAHDLRFHDDYLIELTNNTVLSNERKNLDKQIVIVTGPSGGGKDTMINSLPPGTFVRWKTWTTREKIRADEISDDPYVRATREHFLAEKEKGNFIETNEYSGNLYGTHKREAEKAFADGRIPVLRIDPRGAINFNALFKDMANPFHEANLHHFFIVPPNTEELLRRLKNRDGNHDEVAKRLKAAISDLPFMINAHYILVNHSNKVGEVVNALTSYLESFGSLNE
jgi:guanylate kinase